MVQWCRQAERGHICLPLAPGSWNVLKMDSAWELGLERGWEWRMQTGCKLRNRAEHPLGFRRAGWGWVRTLISQTCAPHTVYTEAAGGEPDGGWWWWPRGRDNSQSQASHISWHCFTLIGVYTGNWEGDYCRENQHPAAPQASQTTGVSSLHHIVVIRRKYLSLSNWTEILSNENSVMSFGLS